MRITTKYVFNMVTGEVLEHEWYEYSGPVAMCKGADEANAQRKQMLDMDQKAFDLQMDQIKSVAASFSKFMTNPEGFSPSGMASMTSDALNQNALAYNQAGNTVRDQITAMGGNGDLPIGGNTIGRLASLSGMAASQKASTLNNLNIMNEQQKLSNMFNAGSLLTGNAATLNGTQSTAAGGASSALNSYITAKNTGFGSSFANALGGSLGAGLGAVATGGLGGFMGGAGKSGFNITGAKG